MKALTLRVNSYVAMLIITLFATGAVTIILRVIQRGEEFVAHSSVGQAAAFLLKMTN